MICGPYRRKLNCFGKRLGAGAINARTPKSKMKRSRLRRPPPALPTFSNMEEFDALTADEKDAVWSFYNRNLRLCESKPLTRKERERFDSIEIASDTRVLIIA